MIRSRLKEAVLTGVPALGLGVMVYRAFRLLVSDLKCSNTGCKRWMCKKCSQLESSNSVDVRRNNMGDSSDIGDISDIIRRSRSDTVTADKCQSKVLNVFELTSRGATPQPFFQNTTIAEIEKMEARTGRWSLQSTESIGFQSTTSKDSSFSQVSATDSHFSGNVFLGRGKDKNRTSMDNFQSTPLNNNNNNNNNNNTKTDNKQINDGMMSENDFAILNYNKNAQSIIIMTRKFDFPSDLCGRLIGKQGRNISTIKKKSGAEICVKTKTYSNEFQTVFVQGTKQQINRAVNLIKKKFPEKKFTNVDYNRNLPDLPLSSLKQMTLPSRLKLDVMISSVASSDNFFVQQINHPAYHNLKKLTLHMSSCYDFDLDVPGLPHPLEVGVLCVVPMYGYWYRCQIVRLHDEIDACDIRLVDYGNHLFVQASTLKQIRSDFMGLPMQATECFLANVAPIKDGDEFSPEMKVAMETLVGAFGLKAEVVSLDTNGIPCVSIEDHKGDKVSYINRNMVENGWAKWIDSEKVVGEINKI